MNIKKDDLVYYKEDGVIYKVKQEESTSNLYIEPPGGKILINENGIGQNYKINVYPATKEYYEALKLVNPNLKIQPLEEFNENIYDTKNNRLTKNLLKYNKYILGYGSNIKEVNPETTENDLIIICNYNEKDQMFESTNNTFYSFIVPINPLTGKEYTDKEIKVLQLVERLDNFKNKDKESSNDFFIDILKDLFGNSKEDSKNSKSSKDENYKDIFKNKIFPEDVTKPNSLRGSIYPEALKEWEELQRRFPKIWY